MDVVLGHQAENSLTIHLDRFYEPYFMIPGAVVIPGDREAVYFIITWIELKSDAFMKFNRSFIDWRCSRPHHGSAMGPADFKKMLV